MINYKVEKLSVLVLMGFFITSLSFSLLVKEFFTIGEHSAKLQAK